MTDVMPEHSVPEQDTGLFDGEEYRVPFPQADGKEVTDLVIAVSGRIELNRNDPEHAELVEGLRLGRRVRLSDVLAVVNGKRHVFKPPALGDDSENVTHVVMLKVEAIEFGR